MKPYKDFNGEWRIADFHETVFSSEQDARAAIALAVSVAMEAVSQAGAQESRYRRASERGQKVAA